MSAQYRGAGCGGLLTRFCQISGPLQTEVQPEQMKSVSVQQHEHDDRMCEPLFHLNVVIPIADSGSTWRSGIEDDAHSSKDVITDAPEDSECTEEEKVAVEQLTELRRIRDLSMQEDTHDGSYSTDGSFNTYDRKLPSLLAAPPSPCDPSSSSATSSSAACRVDFWNLKHMQEQHKSNLKQDVKDACDQNNIQVSTSKHSTSLLGCDHLESDNDERIKPRSRLLSDIYGDHLNKLSTSIQPIKASKKRRKAIRKIMAVGQPHVAEAFAGGKDISTDAFA